MSVYEAPRGAVRDLRFFTKDVVNGSLVDQWNFTDGLTHGQWPIVKAYTGPVATGTDITALVVKDITADTITSASHKDPTGSSGVWRQSQGTYWVRVQPQNALAIDDYYLRISFLPTSANTWVEDFTLEILVPGDIDPNADISPADIRVGFSTSFTDDDILPYIERATDDVFAELEAGGISDPEAYMATIGGMPRAWRIAIIERAQCLIGSYDLSAGTRWKSIQEGSEKITRATPKDGFSGDPCADYLSRLQRWLKIYAPGRQPFMGTVTKLVGHRVNDDGLSNDSDAIWM